MEACLTIHLSGSKPTWEWEGLLDAVSDARSEVVNLRLYAASLIPQLQAEIRRVEKKLTADNPGVKPTPLERLLKTNENYITFEMEMGKLQAVQDYCDRVEQLLEDKAFSLRMKIKDTRA